MKKAAKRKQSSIPGASAVPSNNSHSDDYLNSLIDGVGDSNSINSQNEKQSSAISFSFSQAFLFIALIRGLGVLSNPISDCDEVYNYWEPLHNLLFQSGLQTWEYSPVYALRSYLYLLIHGLPLKLALASGFIASKIQLFFLLRALLAISSAACEAYLYRSVLQRFGRRIALVSLIFTSLSAGMFHSSTSFLPSSFSMNFVSLALSFWFRSKFSSAIFTCVAACLLGWPFCVVALLPIGIHSLYVLGPRSALLTATAATIFISLPILAADYHFYGKLTFSPLNIALYNSFSQNGSELYGTEPWHFYLKNNFLNWNVASAFALLVVPCSLLMADTFYWLMICSPFLLWFSFTSVLPHKEERFQFVAYPSLAVCAAIGWEDAVVLSEAILSELSQFNRHMSSGLQSGASKALASQSKSKMFSPLFKLLGMSSSASSRKAKGVARPPLPRKQRFNTIIRFLGYAVIALFVLLSISRILAQIRSYTAPMVLYTHLSSELARNNDSKLIGVCVGKEWYRFPSSFFFPSDNKVQLKFLESGFKGQLPKYFEQPQDGQKWTSTSVIPSGFNSQNKEEKSRYVSNVLDECDYIVDLELDNQSEELYSKTRAAEYEVIASARFLDSNKTPSSWARAFYVPFVTDKMTQWADYIVLRRK